MKTANGHYFKSQVFYKYRVNFLLLEIALLLLVISFLHFFNELAVFLLQTAAFIMSASGAFSAMATDLRERKIFTENNMFALAAVLAMVMGFTAEAVVATVIFEVLRVYREYNDLNVKSALGSALKFDKTSVAILENNELVKHFANEVRRGDLLSVSTGERVFADGIIKSGEAEIDVSDIFGSSEPYICKTGDKVISGSNVVSGSLVIEAERDYQDTVFHKINKRVISCGKEPSTSERFLLSFLKIFPIAVLCGSVIFGFVVPAAGGSEYSKWIYRAVICIMISVPYALIKSIPAAYVAGISVAARNGIIFKTANAVDMASDLTSVVYDKTGTLSTGEFTVVDIEPCEGVEVPLLLNMAFCVLKDVENPIAETVCAYAASNGVSLDDNIELERIDVGSGGYGVVINGKLKVYCGSAEFMDEIGVAVVPSAAAVSSVYFAASKRYMGRIDLYDDQKNGSYESVEDLKKEGVVNIAMITEDNTLSANRAGKEIGISEIYADCTAEDKIERISYLVKLQSPTERLAYVCGYPYDAEIMKTADLGVIINGIDTLGDKDDISDVVILKDSPSDVAKMIYYAKQITRRNNANILVYIGVKALLIILALFGAMSIWAAMLADSIATYFVLKNTSSLLENREDYEDEDDVEEEEVPIEETDEEVTVSPEDAEDWVEEDTVEENLSDESGIEEE